MKVKFYCAARQDLARRFDLSLGGGAQFKFKARSAMRCGFDLRLALVVKYASARLALFYCSRERRNFAVCVCVLIRLRRKTHYFSACVLREFLFNKFAVVDVSVHATLNFDFNGCGRQTRCTKNQNFALLRALNL